MREIIANLLPYEWYVWLLTGFWSLIWIIIVVYKKTDTLLTNKQKEILGTSTKKKKTLKKLTLNQWEEGILNPEADSLVQKLLQQTEIENEEEARFTDRIEELEREIENEEETQETQSKKKSKLKQKRKLTLLLKNLD
jgi:hypothetical protein